MGAHGGHDQLHGSCPMRVVAPWEEEHSHQALLMGVSKTWAAPSPWGEGWCKAPPSLQMDISLHLWMNLCGKAWLRSEGARPHGSHCHLAQSSLKSVGACHAVHAARTLVWAPSHFLFATGIDIFDSGTVDVIVLDRNDEKDLEGDCEACPLLLQNCGGALEYRKSLVLVDYDDLTFEYSQSDHCQCSSHQEYRDGTGEYVCVFLRSDSFLLY